MYRQVFGCVGCILLIAVSGSIVRDQTLNDTAFEVASVKRVTEPGMIYGIRPIEPSGRFHAIITVYDLIRVAYGTAGQLVDAQIIDAPPWSRNDRFEIIAKVAGECERTNAARAFVLATVSA
jgi:uncharacterized protein (TIGR03435 family)